MSDLLPDLRLKFIRGGWNRLYAVTREFEYRSLVPGVGVKRVGSGKVTDLGSVPWLVQLIVAVDTFAEGFVAHDDLYERNGCTRTQADWVLLDFAIRRAIREQSIWRVIQALIVFAGVRIFGWWTWRTYRKRDAEKQEVAGV
jgi:hypothetical protein